MDNSFGLPNEDIKAITDILEHCSEVEHALIFGSRAKGNYRNGSDVDIALKGSNISYSTILRLSSQLNEETLMPYRFDVLHYDTLTHQDLVEHINRVGKNFYSKM